VNALLVGALVLGAAGSAHCIGMCGPIALAVPAGRGNHARLTSTLLLNGGRLLSYTLLGLAFGSMGSGLRLAGLQQAVSLIAGAILLLSVLVPGAIERFGAQGRLALWISRLRGALARNLARTAPEAIFLSGALNGLLPCGLVYAAAIASTALEPAWQSALFMLLFGIGTLPALFAVRLGGGMIGSAWRGRLRKASPFVVGAMGLLLLVRGSQLDIPYLSPAGPVVPAQANACH
jgi:uncharacterized protein